MRAPNLLMPLVLILSACAARHTAAPVTAAPPASPTEARAELDLLGAEIQRHRASLGLPPSPALPPASAAATAASDGAAAEPSPAPAAEPEAIQLASDEPERRPLARAESDGEDEEYSPPPCSETCRLSAAICRAARRICDLADYLKEPAARSRCASAKVDCDEAREKSGRCPARCR